MKELSMNEVQEVNGGHPFLIGMAGIAVTFKTSYEVATWYGAGELGRWAGGAIYDLTH